MLEILRDARRSASEFFLLRQKEFLLLTGVTVLTMVANEFLTLVGGVGIPFKVRLFALWSLAVYLFRFNSQASVLVGIFFFAICFVFLVLGNERGVNGSALFAYLFFVFAVLQRLIAFFGKRKRWHWWEE